MSTQIHNRRSVIGLLGLILLLSSLSTAFARSGGATNTLTFSESLAEKVVCAAGPSCGLVVGDNFTVAGTVLLTGVNISTFGPTTSFDLTLGTLHISNTLSDDPKYTTGKTSATFVSSYVDGKGKTVVYRTVSLKWTATQLTVSVKGKTTDTRTSGWDSILADAYADYTSGWLTNTITGSISIGDANVTFGSVTCGGTVFTKHITGKDGNPYSPSTVKIKGSGLGSVVRESLPGVHVTPGTDTVVTNLTFGTHGGTVTFSSGPLSGVTIGVPVGALSTNTQISISYNDASVTPQSGTFPGHILNLQVAGGTTFAQPVSITIPFPNDGSAVPIPYYIDTNGFLRACQVVAINNQAGTLTFTTFHASLYTWLYASVTNLFSSVTNANATTYEPSPDGFQVGNPGSTYNPGGECHGMTSFEQWYFRQKGGGLFPKYMQNISLGSGGATIKGQEIIRTRAFNSVTRLWGSYWDVIAMSLTNQTPAQRVASIENVLDNTHIPTLLDVRGNGAHSILAYNYYTVGGSNVVFMINDPNYPGVGKTLVYNSSQTNVLTYGVHNLVSLEGDGSFQMENFENIYDDAEDGFSGNGAAQVNVTSHTDGEEVTDRNITLSGTIDSGQVLVSKLSVTVNGSATVDTPVDPDTGDFSVTLSLNAGTNELGFVTSGLVGNNRLVEVLNTQKQPFKIIDNLDAAAILVTLTWDTDQTDLDLYVTDPTGATSWYGGHTTPDGGDLDYDVQYGYGPEHWTLSYGDTIRWGSNYTVRVHYYTDHSACTYCDPVVPVRPTGWTATVLVYENTPRMATYTFSGVLADADPGNASPGSHGSDWNDVCTITPVQAPGSSMVRKTREGEIQITLPVPPEAAYPKP